MQWNLSQFNGAERIKESKEAVDISQLRVSLLAFLAWTCSLNSEATTTRLRTFLLALATEFLTHLVRFQSKIEKIDYL